MATNVKAQPDGYHTLTTSLSVRGASEAIEFYKKAFGAAESYRMTMPDGSVGHAEIRIGDSVLMLNDENPKWNTLSPQTLGGTPMAIRIYVENVDEAVQRAVNGGATVIMPVSNQFWGDRTGVILDPFGFRWSLATHIEDVSNEEMDRRTEAFVRGEVQGS